MTRKEVKLQAKEIMKSRWGIILLTLFLGTTGMAIAGTIAVGIGTIVVMGPLLLSQYYILEDVRIGKAGNWKDILKGFKISFSESFLAKIMLEIILTIPSIAVIIITVTIAMSSIFSMVASLSMGGSMDSIGSGGGFKAGAVIGTILGVLAIIAVILAVIYLRASYAETFYILMREPGISAVQAMKKSRYMMKGHIKEYIVFVLSFIGWFLLGFVTFYIGFIWILPYYEMSKMVLLADIYENATGNFHTALKSDEQTFAEMREQPEEIFVAPEPEYDTCIKCGARLPDGAKFCGKCGSPQ